MDIITLDDIQRIAEQESSRHNHYYIGVEHLFIAMTKLTHSWTNAILEHIGIEPRFVRYSIRQEIGTSDDGRYWPGFRETPRATTILETTQKYAGIHTATEQHLLLAIIDEGDSIPIRILEDNDVDLKKLRHIVTNWSPKHQPKLPNVPIEYEMDNLNLGDDERLVLQRMFRSYSSVRIERELGGSYTGARLLIVRPVRDHRVEAQVVVKIAERSQILHEQHHYETYVKNTFPPTTAHLLDTPALPDQCPLGGLKYSLVKPTGSANPMNLRDFAREQTPTEIGHLLRDNVYKVYAESLWWQRQRYRFGVWREYEQVLPAALEVEYISTKFDGEGTVIEPLGNWSRNDTIRMAQVVILRKFIVQKIRHGKGSMQLAAGNGAEAVNRASKVEVIGMGKATKSFHRGQIVEMIVGRVTRRREDILGTQLKDLDPPFNVTAPEFTNPFIGDIPNPIQRINSYLDRYVKGYLSLIHGDLHLGNILVGPAGDAWLIDFALVREGHTLFDWAMLEISVLNTVVAEHIEDGWQGIWKAMYLMHQINNLDYHMNWDESPTADAFRTIAKIREIVQENLTKPNRWHEYHIPLMMLSLRGLSWTDTASEQARRLFFGTAALSLVTASKAERGQLSSATGTDMQTDTHFQLPTDVSGDAPPPTSDPDF